jgi:IS30 family transposase
VSGGRPGLRAVRLAFWEGIRAGLGIGEAGRAAGVSHEAARQWFIQAGGVISNGPGPESGRYLTMAEREEIAVGRAAGQSVAVIAAALGRPRYPIYRELGRNGGAAGYRATIARRRRRPKQAKIAASVRLRAEVAARLGKKWSPRQIAATLRQDFPDDPGMHVLHETIYQSLCVCARPRRAAAGAGRLPAHRAGAAQATPHGERQTRPDPGHGDDLRAAGRSGGPGGAGVLGR